MIKFLDLGIIGLNTGIVYGLIAIGYTMVYGIIKLINFAHGEICMIGAMLLTSIIAMMYPEATSLGFLPFLLLLIVTSFSDGFVGIGLDWVAYKPLRNASRLSALITAIGMSLILQNAAILIWSTNKRIIPRPVWFDQAMIEFSGIRIKYFHGMLWVATVVCMVCLYLLVMRTKFGTAMRACSQNPTAASLMGIQRNRVVALTFFLGSFLGAVGGIAFAINKGSVDYQTGLYVGIVAFAAAVLGGIGNIPGAMLGGVIIGVAEAMAGGYLGSVPHPFASGGYVSTGYKEAVAFLVLILIILFRPQGLLGSKGSDRA